jgi:TetR/AcrR family transcriptional regulator, ethionamide resistance regulator
MGSPESEPRRVDPAVLEQRRARRHDKVIARMLGVVEGLLTEQDSYLDLSVEAIIEAGDMSRSTFYRYFDDKVDLIVALGDRAMSEIITTAQTIWELPPGASREQVAAAVQTTFTAYLPHTRLLSAVLEVSTYDKRARDHFGEVYALAQRGLAQHIRAGQAAGSVRAELHPDETAGWLTWMVERGIVQLSQDASRPGLERLHESLTAILWHTLYEPAG